MNNTLIRQATVADAKGIAHVHVDSWRETYAGIVPDDHLRNLSWEAKAEMWETGLRDGKTWKLYVVEDTGVIKGFINIGKLLEPERGYNGKIYALYLLKEMQGRGLGRTLFEKALSALRQEGINSMYLWVLKDNPTIEFYRHMGGKEIARQPLSFGATNVEEIAMAWENLT
jgi:GNAT superfamily N-acetyltransferase